MAISLHFELEKCRLVFFHKVIKFLHMNLQVSLTLWIWIYKFEQVHSNISNFDIDKNVFQYFWMSTINIFYGGNYQVKMSKKNEFSKGKMLTSAIFLFFPKLFLMSWKSGYSCVMLAFITNLSEKLFTCQLVSAC